MAGRYSKDMILEAYLNIAPLTGTLSGDVYKRQVVRRAVAQTIKVVNGIIREMDASPAWVRIELARELSKTFGERQEMDLSLIHI